MKMKTKPAEITAQTELPIGLVRKLYLSALRSKDLPKVFLDAIPTAAALFAGCRTVPLDRFTSAVVHWALTGAHAERDAQEGRGE